MFISKDKTDSFHLMAADTRAEKTACTSSTKMSEGMTKVSYKQEVRAKHRSKSRSDQIRSPYANMTRWSCDTCLRVIWDVELYADTIFFFTSDSRPGKRQVKKVTF